MDACVRSPRRESNVGWFRFARFACTSLALAPLARAAEFPENPDAPSAFSTRIEARKYDDRFATVEEVLSEVPGVRVRRVAVRTRM